MGRVIRVEAPNPRWVEEFNDEAGRIREIVGPDLVAIHHIGSTSIPEIYAKPIIDMLLAVSSIEIMDERSLLFEGLGYEAMGEYGLPGRRFFRKSNAQGLRSHHVHSYAHNNVEVHRHLAFRDFLRAHPSLAQQYSQLKRKLVIEYPQDIESYMAGKDPFIKEMEVRALAWCRHR